MKIDRIARVNELIKRELAMQVYRIINQADFDAAAVTFTRTATSVDLRNCKVLVSIRGTPAKQHHMLGVLKHYRMEFQEAIRKNVVLRYIPNLHFELDTSIAEGAHVLDILNQLHVPEDDEDAASEYVDVDDEGTPR